MTGSRLTTDGLHAQDTILALLAEGAVLSAQDIADTMGSRTMRYKHRQPRHTCPSCTCPLFVERTWEGSWYSMVYSTLKRMERLSVVERVTTPTSYRVALWQLPEALRSNLDHELAELLGGAS